MYICVCKKKDSSQLLRENCFLRKFCDTEKYDMSVSQHESDIEWKMG